MAQEQGAIYGSTHASGCNRVTTVLDATTGVGQTGECPGGTLESHTCRSAPANPQIKGSDAVRKERDAEDRDAEERDAEERDAEERDAEERDAEERDAEERDAEERDAEERDAEERDAEERDAEESDAEERDAEERDAEESDAEEIKSGLQSLRFVTSFVTFLSHFYQGTICLV
ncbi:hypothetical protein NDU88_006184 [Pleurodeles waltl]|uniref:Uncharacterized protein n=1 Tax=Pleurodeles waltl TaxID=8319 RepID=A0AAV7N2B1_PLEWA|nr:hypothetical protein NDU88_006184 [Pleurodeles waltl]